MKIAEIKQAIQEYQIVFCGLHHEKVMLDESSGLPIKSGVPTEAGFERVNLCDKKLRNKRLACAHSGAQTAFNDLLDSISKIDPDIQSMKKRFNEIMLEVYQLDHKKGNLERDIAIAMISGNTEDPIQMDIDSCIRHHEKWLSELQGLKDELLIKIEDLITKQN